MQRTGFPPARWCCATDRLLVLRHRQPGRTISGRRLVVASKAMKTLEAAAEREAFEETGLRVEATRLAYIDDVWGPGERTVKFWFLADVPQRRYRSGQQPGAG